MLVQSPNNVISQSPGDSIAPELWRDTIFACFPGSSVQSNTILRDFSIKRQDLTFTVAGGFVWKGSFGRRAVHTTNVSSHPIIDNSGTDPASISLAHAVRPNWSINTWIFPTAYGSFRTILYTYGTAKVSLGLKSTGGQIEVFRNLVSFSGNTVIPFNKWSHIGASNIDDGSDDTIRFYFNGQPDGSSSAVVYANAGTQGTFITGFGSGSSNRFTGLFDDIIVHERTLVPTEFRRFYDIGRGGLLKRRPIIIVKSSPPSGPDVAATASNTLSLSQLVSPAVDLARSVTSVLSLIQQVRSSIFAKSASSALGLTQLAQATISFADVFTPSVESTLNLTGLAVAKNSFDRSATNILALTHLATNDSIKSHTAASTLSLTQVLAHNFVLASAANTLAFTNTSGAGKNIPQSAANVMVLAQTLADNFRLHSATSALAFTQFVIATVNVSKVISVSNTFTMAQTLTKSMDFKRSIPFDALDDQAELQLTQAVVIAHNIRVQASNTLGLVSEVQLKEHNEAVTSFLSFSQKMGRSLPVSAANTLFLQQEAARIFKLTSQLNLISSANPVIGRDAVSVIPFVSTATILSDFSRSLSQILGIRQSASFQLESAANVECIYSPFVGDVTSGITPPPTAQPTLGTATLTLTHPFVSPTTTLVLRNPELNNSERFQFARINRTTRGGDLKIFSDPTWPKQETLKVQIEALTTAQKDSLVSFFEDNIGLEIGLLDDENRQWKGIITQPDADITDVTGDGCTYSVIFEFEGEQQ